jgi:hypothetical protein
MSNNLSTTPRQVTGIIQTTNRAMVPKAIIRATRIQIIDGKLVTGTHI